MRQALALLLLVARGGVHGHGWMTHPPSRNGGSLAGGAPFDCVGWVSAERDCNWFTSSTTIHLRVTSINVFLSLAPPLLALLPPARLKSHPRVQLAIFALTRLAYHHFTRRAYCQTGRHDVLLLGDGGEESSCNRPPSASTRMPAASPRRPTGTCTSELAAAASGPSFRFAFRICAPL